MQQIALLFKISQMVVTCHYSFNSSSNIIGHTPMARALTNAIQIPPLE